MPGGFLFVRYQVIFRNTTAGSRLRSYSGQGARPRLVVTASASLTAVGRVAETVGITEFSVEL